VLCLQQDVWWFNVSQVCAWVQRAIKELLGGWLGTCSFTVGFLANINEVISHVEQVIYSWLESSRVIISST